MQEAQVNAAIAAIRAISQLYPADVAAICAALSSKVASQSSSNPLNATAVDSLDDLAGYLFDMTNEVEEV